MKNIKIEYDEDEDILDIFRIDSGCGEDHSINDRDLAIISFNTKDEVVGLEFFEASKLFMIPKDILKNIHEIT